jgi:hypothetical protein
MPIRWLRLKGMSGTQQRWGQKRDINVVSGLFFLVEFEVLTQRLWNFLCSGIWRRVVLWMSADVSEEQCPSSSRIRNKTKGLKSSPSKKPACYLLHDWLTIQPWRWRVYDPVYNVISSLFSDTASRIYSVGAINVKRMVKTTNLISRYYISRYYKIRASDIQNKSKLRIVIL